MYRSLSFYGKLVSFVLLVIAMVIIKSYNVFLLVSGMVFILSFINKDKKSILLSLVLFVLTYILEYDLYVFILLRVLLVIVYALIIESSLLSLEKRFLYDKLFYGNNTSKKVREYIKKYYYEGILKKNIEESRRIEKYLEKPDTYEGFLKRQAKKKTNLEIDNFYLLDRIRFDRFSKSKRSKLSFTWSNYDNFYLCVSLILFVIVVVLGR